MDYPGSRRRDVEKTQTRGELAPGMTSNINVGSLVEAASEIADRRLQTLWQLREALLNHDDESALALARRLTGLDEKKKSN